MHPTSPGQDGWHGSKTSGWIGRDVVALFGAIFACSFSSGALLVLAESIVSPFAFSSVTEVGSNSRAAEFLSSCPDLPAFIPNAPFPTDQISLPFGGKKVFCF